MSLLLAAGASAAVSGLITAYTGASQSLIKAELIEKQNAAKIKRLNQQFQFDTQNMFNNDIAIKQQKLKNDVLIEENKLAGQDAFAQAFAGSGVSGRSVDALEAQISSSVAKAHNENQQQATQQKDRQFLGLMRAGQANKQAISDMVSFDAGAEKAANDMATLSAGIQSGVSTFASGGGFEGMFGS